MKAGEVYARFGHQSSKAGHEIHWFENHVGGAFVDRVEKGAITTGSFRQLLRAMRRVNKKPHDSDAATGFVQSTINLVETAASTEPAEPDDSDTQHQQGQAVPVQHRDTFEEDERVGHRTGNRVTRVC
jgi:hypothetical protein